MILLIWACVLRRDVIGCGMFLNLGGGTPMAIQRETRLAELLRRREDLFMKHGPMPTDPATAQKLRQIAVELYELTEDASSTRESRVKEQEPDLTTGAR
jgi:hypothetical protein